MGGFLLLRKAESDPIEELEKRHHSSLAVFEKKGLALRKKIVRQGFALFVYDKYSFPSQDHFEFENDEFIVSTGTSIYRGQTGSSALKMLHGDFADLKTITSELLGSYCIILFRDDKLFVFNDYTGIYRVYCNREKTVLSSSFLALARSLPQKRIARQEFYEYLFHETFYGDRTILQGIDLLDSTHVWQIWPHIAAISQPVSYDKYQEDLSFDEMVARISSNQIDYFRILKDVSGDSVISSLSGGYDSRLMLALMRKVGISPSLFVYGTDDSADVRVAKDIAAGEGLDLDHIDKSTYPAITPERFRAVLEKNYYLFDGLGCTGVFDNGSDVATRIMRAKKARLHLNGGGGEIYRRVWNVPDGQIDIEKYLDYKYGPIHILEDFVDYSVCGEEFDRREYIFALREKIKRILDTDRDWMTKEQLNTLYSFLRHKYWMGMNHSLDNQFSYALTPYAEKRFVFESFSIPENYRSYGRFEAALIKKIDPRLAKYPSAYGFNFYDPVQPQRKFLSSVREKLPYFLQPVVPVAHRKMRAMRFQPPFYFHGEYLREIFPGQDLSVNRYVNMERIKDPNMLSRVLSVELVIEDSL
jgi:asparagine synthase (glutamine-hydrolysing)